MEMDNHRYYQQQQQQQQPKISKKPTKAKRKPIKVKYISSPMMVRASNALEFRAIVQELTGQNSDIGMTEDCGEATVGDGTPTTALLNYSGEFGTPTSTEEPYSGFVTTTTTGGEYDEGVSNVAVSSSSSFEPNEASFWREVSETLFGIHQFPCVLV